VSFVLIVVIMSGIRLGVIMPNVITLSGIISWRHSEWHYAEWHYPEWHYAEWHYAEWHYVKRHYLVSLRSVAAPVNNKNVYNLEPDSQHFNLFVTYE